MMIYVILIISGLLPALWVYLAINSPGIPAPYRDEAGKIPEDSISGKVFLTVGGVRQGMFIRSKNTDLPVLLFLHGGPAFPAYFLIEKLHPGLEDYFTVCYWEQRGSGLSYSTGVTAESMTLEQLASDAIEVTRYLLRRFEKEKIYILGHSGGTAIALPAVSKAPGLYHAYIAMAQLTRQSESERLAYAYMMERFIEKNDKRSINKMKKFRNLETDSDLFAFYSSGFRDAAMHRTGIGTMREMKSVISGIFLPSLTCRAYTLREKYYLWKSKIHFLPKTNLRSETLWTDFSTAYPTLEIPVYFMSGRFDFTVNADLAREYYHNLEAPVKAFHTFENSAHSPLFEEPERFREIIEKDILQGKTDFRTKSTRESRKHGDIPSKSVRVNGETPPSANYTAMPGIFLWILNN